MLFSHARAQWEACNRNLCTRVQSLHASCFTRGAVTPSIEVALALAFHAETAITAELARDHNSMRTPLDAASFDFIVTRGSEAHDNIQLGFNRDLSATLFVTQCAVLVNRVITESLLLHSVQSLS